MRKVDLTKFAWRVSKSMCHEVPEVTSVSSKFEWYSRNEISQDFLVSRYPKGPYRLWNSKKWFQNIRYRTEVSQFDLKAYEVIFEISEINVIPKFCNYWHEECTRHENVWIQIMYMPISLSKYWIRVSEIDSTIYSKAVPINFQVYNWPWNPQNLEKTLETKFWVSESLDVSPLRKTPGL